MRLVIVIGCEIWLVGRDQRQALLIGEIDQRALDAALLLHAVALQLDIEAVAEQRGETFAARGRDRAVIVRKRPRDRPVRSARQRDEVLRLALEPVELDVWRLMYRRFQKRPRVQSHQAAI